MCVSHAVTLVSALKAHVTVRGFKFDTGRLRDEYITPLPSAWYS